MRHKIDFCQIYLFSGTVTFRAYYAKTRRATCAWFCQRTSHMPSMSYLKYMVKRCRILFLFSSLPLSSDLPMKNTSCPPLMKMMRTLWNFSGVKKGMMRPLWTIKVTLSAKRTSWKTLKQ